MIGNYLDEIEGGLFIGNAQAASNYQMLQAYNIKATVNVAKSLNAPWWDGIQSYKVGLADGKATLENEVHMYVAAAELVILLLERGLRVLLHCHEGVSRSGAIGVLVVSKMKNISLTKAHSFLLSKRPIIFINKSHVNYIVKAREILNAKG